MRAYIEGHRSKGRDLRVVVDRDPAALL